ncbi:MAG: M3 family oligoendopeptidase [bacterium]
MPLDLSHTVWNLSPLLTSDTDPNIEKLWQEVEKANAAFVTKWQAREDYLTDPSALKESLDDYELLERTQGTSGSIGYYFQLRSSQDENDATIKAGYRSSHDRATKIYNQVQFYALKLAKVTPEKLEEMIKAEPDIEAYRHFLERLQAEAPYLLTEPEERILNLKSLTSHHNWVQLTSGALAKAERNILLEDGKQAKKGLSEIMSLLQSQQKPVRDESAKALNSILVDNVELAEAELNSILADKKTNDELRGLPRPDLARHLSDDIDSEAVDTLLKTVESRFDLSKRYYALKAKLMGMDKLAYHERNVQYGSITKKYPYEDAVELVHRTFQKLNPRFAEILSEYLENGQIDVYPRPNKQSGAFCAHDLPGQPTYILLNHTDILNDVLTLAHEMGHGINNELIKEKQNALHFGTPMATAEVASTFMEDFVLEEILKEADDELRLAILMMKLNDDVSSIFRQVACYRFEQALHEAFRAKSHLTKEEIGEIFQKNMAAYMGDGVEQSEGAQNWWVYWSHIRNYFYVYSYASGLLISKSLQSQVKADPSFIKKVETFLSTGLSDSPQAIFQKLGINITDEAFWTKGLGEIEHLLDETEVLAKKLGKL